MLRIPSEAKAGIEILAKSSNDFVQTLYGVLQKQRPHLSLEKLCKAAFSDMKNNISEEDFESLFNMLTSLYLLLKEEGLETDEVVFEIADAVSRDENIQLNDDELDLLIDRLFEFLYLEDSIKLSYKASNIKADNQNVFLQSKIYTDIRPIFREDINDKDPVGFVVIHNLKVQFSDGSGDKEFYVTLDSQDLEMLQIAVKRALDKEASVGRILKSKQLFYIE
ncbi:MAG TPA: hypothetical protein V6D29_04975 [Leptolyngbyaceae cyanobacterium]